MNKTSIKSEEEEIKQSAETGSTTPIKENKEYSLSPCNIGITSSDSTASIDKLFENLQISPELHAFQKSCNPDIMPTAFLYKLNEDKSTIYKLFGNECTSDSILKTYNQDLNKGDHNLTDQLLSIEGSKENIVPRLKYEESKGIESNETVNAMTKITSIHPIEKGVLQTNQGTINVTNHTEMNSIKQTTNGDIDLINCWKSLIPHTSTTTTVDLKKEIDVTNIFTKPATTNNEAFTFSSNIKTSTACFNFETNVPTSLNKCSSVFVFQGQANNSNNTSIATNDAAQSNSTTSNEKSAQAFALNSTSKTLVGNSNSAEFSSPASNDDTSKRFTWDTSKTSFDFRMSTGTLSTIYPPTLNMSTKNTFSRSSKFIRFSFGTHYNVEMRRVKKRLVKTDSIAIRYTFPAYSDKSTDAITLDISKGNFGFTTVTSKPAFFVFGQVICPMFSSMADGLQKSKIYLYKYKNYNQALAMFEDAIKLCPDFTPFYGNRSFYYLMLKRYNEALKDAQMAVEYDPYFVEGYICMAKCCIALGDISGVEDVINTASKVDGECLAEVRKTVESLRQMEKKIQTALLLQDYSGAVALIDRFVELCPATSRLKGRKAKCLSRLGQIPEALAIADECLLVDDSDTEALYAKALCSYHNCELLKANDYFQRVISIDPSAIDMYADLTLRLVQKLINLEKEVNEALERDDYITVACIYSKILNVLDASNKNYKLKLYYDKAANYIKLNEIRLAIDAYNVVLALDKGSVKALHERAKLYSKLLKYEDALKDYEAICKIDDSEENKQLLHTTKISLQKKVENRVNVKTAERLAWTRQINEAKKLVDDCLEFNISDIEALYVKGLCYYLSNEFDLAIETYEKVIQLNPSHEKALKEISKVKQIKLVTEKGSNAFKNEQWHEFLRHCVKAVQIDERNRHLNAQIYCNVAVTQLKLENPHLAIKAYTNALLLNKYCYSALRGRAQCYYELRDYFNAVRDYEQCYNLDKRMETKKLIEESKIALEKKSLYKKKIAEAESLAFRDKLQEALSIAEECIQFNDFDEEAHYVKGLCLYYMEQYNEALKHLERAVVLKPLHKFALKLIQTLKTLMRYIEEGKELIAKCQWKEALNKFDETLMVDATNKILNSKIYYDKANVYLNLNKIHLAIVCYTSALELNEKDLDVRRERAKCYAKRGDLENAVKDFEEICSVENTEINRQLLHDARTALEIKESYRKKVMEAERLVRLGEIANAKRVTEECLQFNSSDTEALYVKGLCFYFMDQYEESIECYNQVLLLEPAHTKALKEKNKTTKLKITIERGHELFKKAQWHLALDVCNEALLIDDENKKLNIKLYCNKAFIYTKLDKMNLAIKAYTSALKLDENSINILHERATCYCQIEDFDSAIKDYEKLCIIDENEKWEQHLDKAKASAKVLRERQAQENNELGNKLCKLDKYEKALIKYKEAIRLCPDVAIYYCNTCRCYSNLGRHNEAIAEAQKAMAIDINVCKGIFITVAKSYLTLDDMSNADKFLTKASDAGYDCTKVKESLGLQLQAHTQAVKAIEERNYEHAIACLDRYLQCSPSSLKAKLLKAECLAMLGQTDQALEIVDACLQKDRRDAEALFMKGLCLYYNEKFDAALKHFQEVVRLWPDHGRAAASYKKAKLLNQKIKQADEEFKKGELRNALLLYNEALTIDTTNIKMNARLYYAKATIYSSLKQTQEAADACTSAIELDENYVKAIHLRAKCYTILEEYDCVLEDYEQLYKINPTEEIKELMRKTKQSLEKKSNNKDYYKILGIKLYALNADVKKAYKKLALEHHPDRHSNRPKFERKRQERRFKEVAEAYNILSDPGERALYDVSSRYNNKKGNGY